MNPNRETKFNTICNKYPTHRDEYVKGCWKWLKGRRADDNAEGLWRVWDKLYDLSDYVEKHPGGREWLILAKGTDITEAFEVFHMNSKPAEILKKYYVREAKEPRNYRLTFNENDFYQTIKRKVVKKLKTIDVKKESWKSRFYFDFFLLAMIMSACASVYFENNTLRLTGVCLAGMFACFIVNAGHNFIHLKNNWRMFGCHVVFVNFREFRTFHAMSHHLYPNTVYDLETTIYEPFFKMLPIEKNTLRIMISYAMAPIVHLLSFHGALVYRIASQVVSGEQIFYLDDLIGCAVPLLMLLIGKSAAFTSQNVFEVFIAWNMIIVVASIVFSVIGLNAGHHGTEITHEGDEFKSLDFAIHQMAATIDRLEANSNLFMILTHYGEHILHHFFPSLDHAILYHFRDELIETCTEFKEELRQITLFEATIEQYKQQARTKTFELDKKNE
ncbi:cytochrome b5-related protein-like [Chironomus tepperi]|uniref:cytochrome b5-related protein-like n=1 Tax=Chironomus tepperi TaxID=113505 RepID=UPI00391F140A